MARALDAGTLAALGAGRIIDRGLILFDFASGIYGFWTGLGPFTHNGVTYVGAGSLLAVDEMSQISDGSAVPLVVTLSSIENTELSPDILATIEAETYHQRPVVVSTAYFNADDGTLLSVETEYRGYLDKIEHEETVGGAATLRAFCESKARDHLKTGYRMRSDADQRRVNPTDGFYRHTVNAATQQIYWGRKAPGKAG